MISGGARKALIVVLLVYTLAKQNYVTLCLFFAALLLLHQEYCSSFDLDTGTQPINARDSPEVKIQKLNNQICTR